MKVVGAFDHCSCGRIESDLAIGAVFDVEDEVARAVATVADEGTSGRSLGIHGDGGDVDTIPFEPTQVEPAEIVVPDTADDAAGLT